MERNRRPSRYARLVAALAAAVLTACGLVVSAETARAADADVATNGGFESGLTGWSCTGGSGVTVSTPVHGGTAALKATPAGSHNAKCAQTVTVRPNSAYTLSAWVQEATSTSAPPAPAPPTSQHGPRPRRVGRI